MSTFVSVGNALQPFSRLLEQLVQLESCLPKPVYVQSGHNTFDVPNYTIEPFMPQAVFERRMNDAKVVITHAGVGSVLNALRLGKKAIVVPRRKAFGEHVNDHQVDFAHRLCELGLVSNVPDISRLRELVEATCCEPEMPLKRNKTLVDDLFHTINSYIN